MRGIPKTNAEYEKLVFWLWKRNFKPNIDTPPHMVEDIQMELRTIALETEAAKGEYRIGDREYTLYGYIQAKLYRFIRAYGFRRPRGCKGYVSQWSSLVYYSDSLESGGI